MLFILSKYTNVVNYDVDKGWSSVFNKSKVNNATLKDTQDFVSYIERLGNIGDRNVGNIAKIFGNVSDSVIQAANDLKAGKITLEQFKASATSATSAFAATLKSAAASMAIMMGINLAIKTVTWALDELIVTSAELEEKAVASAEEFNRLTKEGASLNNELKTTDDKIKELESKPSLSFIEQEELQKLRDASNELRDQIELNKALTNVAQNKSRDSAIDFLNSQSSYEQYGEWDMSGVYTDDPAYHSHYGKQNVGAIFSGNQLEVTKQQLLEYEDLLQRKQNVEKRIQDFKLTNPDEKKYALAQRDAYNNLKFELQSYDNALKSLNDTLYENVPKLDQFKNALNPDYDQSLIDAINEITYLYSSAIGNGAQEATKSFNEIWQSADFASARDELERLAAAGKITGEVLESNKAYWDILKEIGKTSDEIASHINNLVQQSENAAGSISFTPFSKEEMISAVQELSDGFDQLDRIWQSLSDENPFDFSLLDNKTFKETFSDLGDVYTDFIEQLTSSPNDIEKCGEAFQNLLTGWLNSTDVIANVSDETAALTTAMLTNMGVSNAEELVSSALANNQAYLAAERYYNANAATALKNATLDEYVAFLEEANASGISQQQLARLELAKIAINNTKIDSASDIDQIIGLANAAGASASALGELERAKSIYAAAAAGTSGGLQQLDKADEIIKSVSQGTFDYQWKNIDPAQFKTATYSTGQGSSGSSYGGGRGSDAGARQIKTYNWIQKKIELLREEYSRFNDKLNDSNNSYRTQLNFLSEAKRYLEEIVSAEKQAEDIYFANWETASAGLSDTIRQKIMYGDFDLEEYTSGSEAIDRAQEAWDQYKDQMQKRREDEKALQELLQSGYEKQVAWHTEEAESLKDRASSIQRAYMEEIFFLERAAEKEKQVVSLARQHAADAKREWNEAIALIKNEDIARIMNGTVDLSSYADDYRKLVEDAIKAGENKADADKDLIEKEQDLEDTCREVYEKALEYITAQQDYISSIKSTIESEMDLAEDSGGLIIEAQYEDLISQNDRLIEQYEDQMDLIQDRIGEVDKESAEYYELLGDLEACTQEINNARGQQAKWNRELKLLPVERINKFLVMLDLIKTDLQDFMDWETTLGQANSREEFQQLIDLESERIEKLKEQLETQEALLSDYEYGSDLYNDTLSDINDIADAISQAANEQQEYNQELLNLPLDRISKLNEGLQTYRNILQDQLDTQETAISAVTGFLQKEMDALSRQQDEITEKYQEQIAPIEEQLENLEKQNEALNVQRNLEQSLYDLERAKNQKTNKVIRNGEIQYDADPDAIRTASQSVADAQYEKVRYELEQSKVQLEELRDQEIENLDAEIDRLDQIRSRWEDICGLITQSIDEQAASSLLGTDWKVKLLSGNDSQMYEDFYNLHSSTKLQSDSLEKQIESNERIISQTQIIIDRFHAQEITLKQACDAVNKIRDLMSEGYTADEQLSTQLTIDQAGSILEFSQQINGQISDSMHLLQDSFSAANENNLKIVEIMGTQAEKLEEIRALDEENKRLYEEMLKKIEERNRNYKYHNSDSGGSSYNGENLGSSDQKPQGIYTSEGNGRGSYHDYYDDNKDYTWHTGINNGLVGKGSKSRAAFLKHIATETLDPNERYIKVLAGEAVLTEGQQNQLIDNFQALKNAAPLIEIPPLHLPDVNSSSAAPSIEVNIDNISLPDVRDVDGFAKAMKTRFEPLLRQEISKY